jgi:small conductance mechanosensitive channel
MTFTVVASKYGKILIAVIATATLCGLPPALAQVAPAPPQFPTPAPSTNTKKPDGDKTAADKSAAATSEASKTDTPKSDAGKKADTGREAVVVLLTDPVGWIRLHGLSVLLILAMAAGILWLANRLHKRLVTILAGHATRGTAAEQENRARTLVGVLHNALRTAVIAVAAIMVLEEIGVKVSALLGGVAVAGLAVAFGAQSLIKDFFTGFLVLLEQQYMIGDVIKLSGSNFSGITGQVEQITLRITVLRDIEGAVHFVPHGQINLVSNLTHGWSQAVFDLHVTCSEHVERVRDLFFELTRDLRGDSSFGPMILNDPEMLGVDSLGDSTFTVRFALKTLPLKRWEVKRELLRRIKEKFQEQNIKVSVPA